MLTSHVSHLRSRCLAAASRQVAKARASSDPCSLTIHAWARWRTRVCCCAMCFQVHQAMDSCLQPTGVTDLHGEQAQRGAVCSILAVVGDQQQLKHMMTVSMQFIGAGSAVV